MLKAAVIGLGQIGLMYDLDLKRMKPSSHTLAYKLHSSIDLVAASDIRGSQEQYLKQIAPDAKFYLDMKDLFLEDAIDVISLCTPPSNRYSEIEMVANNSPVQLIFCEKPIASSLEEARRILQLAKAKQIIIMPNLSRRWNKGMNHLRKMILEQTLGQIEKINIRYTRGIYNTGSHIIDLVRFLAGPINEVRVLEKVWTTADLEGESSYSFMFTVGQTISGFAQAFNDKNYYMFEIDLYFEQGKVEISSSGDVIKYYKTGDHPLFSGFQSLKLNSCDEDLLNESHLANAVQHIVDILYHHIDPICTLEDGIYPLLAAEALVQSFHNHGSSVKVAETYE